MSFAEEYIAQLERFAARSALPRVHALHLPPRYVPGVGNQGEFCALELDDGSLGLAFVLLGDTLEQLRAERDGYGLAGVDALAMARRYAQGAGIARTLGFAAANSLTRCLFDRAAYVPE